MLRVVFEANAATPEKHVKRDEELEQRYEKVDWDHVSWPKEEEGVKHVQHSKCK